MSVEIKMHSPVPADKIRAELEALLREANQPCSLKVEEAFSLNSWVLTLLFPHGRDFAIISRSEQTPWRVASVVRSLLRRSGLLPTNT